MNGSSPSEQNHFEWDETYNDKYSINKGALHVTIQAHLGKSSQDSKKSLKKYRITRGRSPSPLLGALNANPNKGLCTIN